ncbi:hypothetical protein [Subtercola sp. YIM 133946]|uniref:hypothetical protein n=1 Tax=Subtercola sp. YIM 133946 TaxID=3118909 RepID=UPI002F923244
MRTPEESDTPSGAVSRRSVVTAAAWSVPVVALAVAAPAAAASDGDITISFVVAGLILRHSDTLSVLLAITNNGADDVTDDAQIMLTGIPGAEVDLDFDPDADTVPGDSNQTVMNSSFVLAAPNDVSDPNATYTLTGNLTVPARSTLYIFFTLTWHADNHHDAAFVIAGTFTFGDATPPESDITIERVDDTPPPPDPTP